VRIVLLFLKRKGVFCKKMFGFLKKSPEFHHEIHAVFKSNAAIVRLLSLAVLLLVGRCRRAS
jgi:hypothetical protein